MFKYKHQFIHSTEPENHDFNSNGKAIFKNGSVYTGKFVDGKMSGFGTFQWKDGTIYKGEFTNDKITGQGTFIWGDTCYQGQVLNSKRHGHGKLYFKKDSSQYIQAEWNNGKACGNGVCRYTNGSEYRGELKDNKRHGTGTMYYKSGNIYHGQWVNNLKHGKGKMTWKLENLEYDGEWKDDKPNGYGTAIWKFEALRFHQYPLQNIYEGNWVDGVRHGHGIFYYSNGAKYTGDWVKNLKEGDGLYISDNGRIYNGKFHDDRPVENFELFNNEKCHLFNINSANTDIDQSIISLNRVISRYTTELRRIYQKCCEMAKPYIGQRKNLILKSTLWEFLIEMNIKRHGYTLATLNRTYAKSFKNNPAMIERYNNPHNPDTEFLFHDFLEYLILISCFIHAKSENLSIIDDKISASFSYFLKTDILYDDDDFFQPLLLTKSCKDILAKHSKKITEIFNQVSISSKNSLEKSTQDKTLTFRQFILLLKEYKILEYFDGLNIQTLVNELAQLYPGIQKQGHINLELEMIQLDFIMAVDICAKSVAEYVKQTTGSFDSKIEVTGSSSPNTFKPVELSGSIASLSSSRNLVKETSLGLSIIKENSLPKEERKAVSPTNIKSNLIAEAASPNSIKATMTIENSLGVFLGKAAVGSAGQSKENIIIPGGRSNRERSIISLQKKPKMPPVPTTNTRKKVERKYSIAPLINEGFTDFAFASIYEEFIIELIRAHKQYTSTQALDAQIVEREQRKQIFFAAAIEGIKRYE